MSSNINTVIRFDQDRWKVLYQECHAHLREQDKKRDQTLALFIALTGYLLSKDYLFNSQQSLGATIYIGMFFLGILIAFVLIKYKLWHEKYILSAKTVGFAMMSEKNFTYNDFNSVFKNYLNKSAAKINFKNVFSSTESLVFNVYLLINSINIFVGLNILYGINKNNIIIVILLALFYLFGFNLLVFKKIKNLYSNGQNSEDVWILSLWINNEK